MQALEMVGQEMGDPMSSEVRRVLREMHLGLPTEQALLNMGERVGSKDFDMVITAILIQRQVGGNLAEVQGNISNTIRSRIQLAGEVKTLTAQGRLSGLLIGFLPVFLCMALYFLNKEYIMILFTDPRGLMLLGIGVVAEIVGVLLINKIVDIKM
jgi:tight adherence protein B